MNLNISTERKKRNFVSETFVPNTWNTIEPYFKELLETEFNDVQSFRRWLRDRSELEAIISENTGWRYIKMTCDTSNKEHQEPSLILSRR
jgi:oligoendopeptidase F